MFVVIEGLDRAGKTTQIERLRDVWPDIAKKFARSRLIFSDSVEVMHFPDRSTAIGKLIDAHLQSDSPDDGMTPQTIHLLFSANRWEMEGRIIATRIAGTSILCDRYSLSGTAFSLAKGVPGMDQEWCEAPDEGLPEPDLTIFLDIPPDVAASREGYGAERFEEANFQARARSKFLDLIGQHKYAWTQRYVVVRADGHPDAVHDAVRAEVEKELDSWGERKDAKEE